MPEPLTPTDDRAAPAASGARSRADETAVEQAAATWALRRRAGLDANGRAQLQAWLAADPRHADALEALSATLERVRALPAEDAQRWRPQPARPASAARRVGWRPWLPQATAAVLAVAVVGTAGLGWWRQPTFEQTYATTRGQQIRATLPDASADGSTVQLDTATRLHVRLFRDRREVELRDGQAMFAVHPDSTRPFHVLAGGLRITVVGTRFSVRHTATGVGAGHTTVAVEEGHVRVAPVARGAPAAGASVASAASVAAMVPVDLRAGQTVSATGQGQLGAVATLAPSTVAPWRAGRLSFHQVPLAQALAEFERYGSTHLVVRDPAVAALEVSGSYGVLQSQRFAEFLPQLLPVRLQRQGATTEIVAR
ncbi:FecR domain-containing protein [Paracidovorax wautersii]|uniref:Transmembrane sensor n=1 Tax=Paracidovorax wautersii TaxID=1177982 RepID=A0ABU1I8D8_9BURK|nr:FecR domain-containing protein [Paracidovorax wautersii]MDR6213487.1 transmembrane sensor [Paracidovorax wautersii]